MSSTSITLNSLLAAQVCNARIQTDQIAAVAAHLAQLMGNIHDGEWITDISHEFGAEFVLVRPRFRKAGAK